MWSQSCITRSVVYKPSYCIVFYYKLSVCKVLTLSKSKRTVTFYYVYVRPTSVL